MGAVANQAEIVTPAIPNGGAMDRLIERALSDPNFDVEKLERLFALSERTKAAQAEQAFNAAMRAAQAEILPVARTAKNSQTNSKYATLEAVNEAIVPIITKHGLSISFGTDASPLEGHYRVTCVLSHDDGHSRTFFADIPADLTGLKGTANKTATHAFGSTMSYGRRYLTLLVFNVATTDDDGNASGSRDLSRACQDHLAAVNMAEGVEGLRAWKAEHFQRASDQLPAHELKLVIELYNRRLRAAKTTSDFPGDH